ncbi:MAG: hypothetical protein BWY63_02658 [Chloroflexi bacterium ADurb.Bin360]|nr:MAG: hypothetical protein BWY63_02658 [Chloroflexi bacterium ADurb.Bin360]
MLRVLWLQFLSQICHIWLWTLHTAYDYYCRRQWRQGRAALSFKLWRRWGR